MKAVIIVIYNHKYDKNIEIIEKLYKNRFSKIYHLVPFYTGAQPNVIPVYENSLYFEGYVAQGFSRFFQEDATHYFFVADDMIIHPDINEANYAGFFQLDDNQSFISEFFSLYQTDKWWPHTVDAFSFRLTKRKVEVQKELPDYQEAEKRLLQNEAIDRPFNREKALKWENLYEKTRRNTLQGLLNTIRRKKYVLDYPLAASYSDIFIVSSADIRAFCHYCGVFAALELFVEIAIPTALALSAKGIITEKNLSRKGKPLWKTEDYAFLAPYKTDLETLVKNYPQEILYIHPIKLSQWNCSVINV